MRETEALKCKRKDIGSNVQESTRKRQKVLHQVENWLVAAANTEAEVDLIKSEFDERRTIMNGHCTDYFSRYMLGKRAIKKLDEVKDLIEKGTLDRLSAGPSSPPPPKAAEMPMILMRGQRTSEQTLKKIQHYLHDEETGILCVYGIGGVGKTTLMRSINNRLVGSHDFEAVIWVTVSKDGNSGRIQKEIGKKLGLNFRNNETEEEKCMELFAVLKNMRYMLIFDDIWQEICLEEVRIPKPNKQKRCKIVITTRIIQVGNVMEADVQIRVSTLTRKEGWDLFCYKAGDVVLLPDIRALAEDVADECSGLPLAITTVGRAKCEERT
ncbi:disease resistance protein RPS2-like [Magnolia sinica]|uniref:disease resistance protein RPS2-like n=1 Tax=Magnolia sinica TaxID=86752 RepID=UPI00265A7196|nr:disease resistance protein RPS2-like [Magnolia sinica]